MILKGSQRGHGRKLAQHLLNDVENDFVEVHSVDGFLSDDVTGAIHGNREYCQGHALQPAVLCRGVESARRCQRHGGGV